MTITAMVLADSIASHGIRLTTMQLRYPKFIHGEFMTHRVFSRNASSSRAIPVARLIQDTLEDPAMPVYWGKNQKGMQAAEECNATLRDGSREESWLLARDRAIEVANDFANAGYHKQIVNRLIEPWCHINVVVTATDWANFFALRRHPDAQPEMKTLADAMWEARQASTPTRLRPGQWHLPYVDAQIEDDGSQSYLYHIDDHGMRLVSLAEAIKLSVARCARVSYLTHEGKRPSMQEDLALYDRLLGSRPLHASPFEHQAMPDQQWPWKPPFQAECAKWEHPEQWGNLHGWRQYRKMLHNECVREARGAC